MESLGIAYVALYLKTAPAEAIDADLFDALGSMSERLARRASVRGAIDPTLPAHLEVARSYGITFASVETEGRARICYDGDAFQRVLALGGTIEARARAALSLTDARCRPADLGHARALERAEYESRVLDAPDVVQLQPAVANRIRMRRVAAWSRAAYELAKNRDARGGELAMRAVDELARVDRAALESSDQLTYEQAAVLAASVRYAAEADRKPRTDVEVKPGEAGQTCLHVGPELARCTFGVLWASSLRESPNRERFTVAASPLPGWVELWVFSRAGGTWKSETLIPAVAAPELGYVEHAGWLPDNRRLLAVREASVEGAVTREFLIVDAETAAVEKRARTMAGLGAFKRHAGADWKNNTLALR
jgi:hypothetical protein